MTIATDAFAFARPVEGLEVIAKAGTLLARDGDAEVRTPYANSVLVMPTRRPEEGRDGGAHRALRQLDSFSVPL